MFSTSVFTSYVAHLSSITSRESTSFASSSVKKAVPSPVKTAKVSPEENREAWGSLSHESASWVSLFLSTLSNSS